MQERRAGRTRQVLDPSLLVNVSNSVAPSMFLSWAHILPLLILLQNSGPETSFGAFCIIVFIFLGLAFGLSIWLSVQASIRRTKALGQAWNAYQRALSQLKSDSTNPDLKQQTLQFGRVYSNLSRNKRGVTVFDEVALMNDINAACAHAGAKPDPSSGKPNAPSIEERLGKLSDLRSMNLIDEDEYQSRRQRILDEV